MNFWPNQKLAQIVWVLGLSSIFWHAKCHVIHYHLNGFHFLGQNEINFFNDIPL